MLLNFVWLIFCWEEDIRESRKSPWPGQSWECIFQIFFMRDLAKRSVVNWQPALQRSWRGYSLFRLLPANDFAPRRYSSYCTAQCVTHLMGKFCSGTFHQPVETIKAFSELHYCLNLSFPSPLLISLFRSLTGIEIWRILLLSCSFPLYFSWVFYSINLLHDQFQLGVCFSEETHWYSIQMNIKINDSKLES